MKWLGLLVTIMASNVVIAQEAHKEMFEYMKPGLSFESATLPGDGSTKIVGLKYTEDGVDYSLGTDNDHNEYGLKRKIVDGLCEALGFKGAVNFFSEKTSNVNVAYLASGSTSDYDYGEGKLTLKKNKKNSFVINKLLCYSGSDLSDLQVSSRTIDESKDSMVVTDPAINYEGTIHPMMKQMHSYYDHGVCRAFGYKEVFVNSMTCSQGGVASASFDANGYVLRLVTESVVGTMNSVGTSNCRITKMTCTTKIRDVEFKVLE